MGVTYKRAVRRFIHLVYNLVLFPAKPLKLSTTRYPIQSDFVWQFLLVESVLRARGVDL